MSEFEFLGPAIAVVALFAVVALAVQVIRLGRAVRRLSDRLESGAGSARELPIARLEEIGAKVAAESAPERQRSRIALISGAGALLVLLAAGGVLLLASGGGDGGGPSSADTEAQNPPPELPGSTPDPGSTVPSTPPAITDKSIYTVLVLNASGIDGLARNTIAPLLVSYGYQVPAAENAPSSDFEESVVMFAEGNRALALNVAADLGITKVAPRDGFDLRGADAAVFVGRDLQDPPTSTGSTTSTTTGP